MNTASDKDRLLLTATIQSTLLHTPMSQADIARRVGVTRQAINRYLNEGATPSAVIVMRLSRLASAAGLDQLADLFSAEGRRTVPVPESFAGRLDGSIRDESYAVSMHHGKSLWAWDHACLHDFIAHWKTIIAQGYQAIAEAEARLQHSDMQCADMQHAGVQCTGDGLPAGVEHLAFSNPTP